MLVFCLPFYSRRLLPAEREVAKRSAAAAAAQRARLPAQPVSAPDGAAELERFYRRFPTLDALQAELEALYAHARASSCSSRRASTAWRKAPGLAAYRVTLPVRGSYAQLRQFVGRVLKDMPTASLDAVRFERSKARDAQLEAQVRLTIYLGRWKERGSDMRTLLLVLFCSRAAPRRSIRRCARRATTSPPGAASRRSRCSSAPARENPDRLQYRAEYFRVRDLRDRAMAGAGRDAALERPARRRRGALSAGAEARPGQRARARRACSSSTPTRATAAWSPRRSSLIKDERYLEAQDALRPVLAENPQHARRAAPAAPDRGAHRASRRIAARG